MHPEVASTRIDGFSDRLPQPQRVLITAAASGIGRSIAEAFVRNGAEVQLCDVDAAALDECRSNLPQARSSHVDLTDSVALNEWLAVAAAELGGVDVLVNNAGVKGPTAFVEDISIEEWRSCLSIGLDAQFICCRQVVPVMKRQRSGRIINISSTAGLFGVGLRTPYAATKWAVIGLTKSLAVELGPYGVTCNCICPGSVRGTRIDHVIGADAALRDVDVETVRTEYLQGQSIHRFVEPSEVAALCIFLASPAAAMISGQALAIDGNSETFHI